MTVELIKSTARSSTALQRAGVENARHAVAGAFRAINQHIPIDTITVEKDALGKPYGRISGRRTPVALSISHAFPYIFTAASTEPYPYALGIDIERIRDFEERTWQAFLTPAEKIFIARASLAEQPQLRTLAWSLKESTLKALGTGLRIHPRTVEVIGALAFQEQHIEVRGFRYDTTVQQWAIGTTHIATAVSLRLSQEDQLLSSFFSTRASSTACP